MRAVKQPIDDAGIAKLLAAMDAVLARAEPMTILWDVRSCSLPSRKQLGIALEWIGENSHLLDQQLQGIAIIFSSLLVRSVTNFVLSVTSPPQPHGVFSEEPPAFAFARDQCTEIKVWVSKRKLEKKMAKLERQSSAKAAAAEGVSPTSTRQPSGSLFWRQGSRNGKSESMSLGSPRVG